MNGAVQVPLSSHITYGQVTVPGPPQGVSSNPVAIVTGSAQGIGYGIAVRLAADGFDIALNDLPSKSDALADAVKTIKALGRRAISVPGDVTKEEEVVHMVDETVRLLGGLDVMVANAGIFTYSSILEASVEDFERIMRINVCGVMLCYKHAAKQMIRQGRGGRIIGASSCSGLQGAPFLPLYSATKFAIRGLTQSVGGFCCISVYSEATELASHRITVNCYAPGIIMTPMTANPDGKDDNAAWLKSGAGVPMDAHCPGPEVVASIVSYVCKPEAYFITGEGYDLFNDNRETI